MRLFLRDVEFSAEAREVDAPGSRKFRLKPFQIPLWISVTPRGYAQLPPDAPKVLSLLDTGHNHNISLREDHLHWCALGFDQAALATVPLRVRDASGREWDVPRLQVDVWLHSNLERRRPFPIRFGLVGAACYLAGGPVAGPPLPTLGVRSLCVASLSVELHCHSRGGRLNLRVPAKPQ